MTTSSTGEDGGQDGGQPQPPEDQPSQGSGRDESPTERLDRNFDEQLQELRVSQTGVQILFAFLLTLAFTQRFEQTSGFERAVYMTTLMLCAGATGLLIAPVAFHRLNFRRGLKPQLVAATNRLALGGLALLLLAVVGAVLLVGDVVLGGGRAVLLAALIAAWFIGFWVVLPLVVRRRESADYDPPSPEDEPSGRR
jgi:hypothetical protein